MASFLFLAGCEDKAVPTSVLPTVTFMRVISHPFVLTSELSGRTSAFMVSEVRPQVSGIIQQRLFDEGSDVERGQVLYQIDPSLYRAAYDNARATLRKAEANEVAAKLLAERYEQVVKVNAVSKQEYDNAVAAHGQAKAEVAAAQAALDTATINLDYTKVRSPVSGRIGRSMVTPGALVTQNQPAPLATVQQLDPMYVDVTQSSSELLRLRRAFASGALKSSGEGAMQATLKLEDGTPYTTRRPKKDPATGEAPKNADAEIASENSPVIGWLKFSDVTVEQSTGVVTIRAIFPNPDGILLPGMYVRAVLEEGVSEKAILIPQKAVIRNNRGLPVVQVLTPDSSNAAQNGVYHPEARILTVSRSVGNQWLVTDGLTEGELIVLEGLMKIQGGGPVKGVPDAALPGPGENANAAGPDTGASAGKGI
jgi:membrane fusion protein (multidrug efflux system)